MAQNKPKLTERIRTGFGLPDFGKMQEMFDARFGDLVAKLDEMLVVLKEIRDAQRQQHS